MKWSFEISEFDPIYHPRSAIKAQHIVDFLAEFTNDSGGGGTLGELSEEVTTDEPKEYLNIYVDEFSNSYGNVIGSPA